MLFIHVFSLVWQLWRRGYKHWPQPKVTGHTLELQTPLGTLSLMSSFTKKHIHYFLHFLMSLVGFMFCKHNFNFPIKTYSCMFTIGTNWYYHIMLAIRMNCDKSFSLAAKSWSMKVCQLFSRAAWHVWSLLHHFLALHKWFTILESLKQWWD